MQISLQIIIHYYVYHYITLYVHIASYLVILYIILIEIKICQVPQGSTQCKKVQLAIWEHYMKLLQLHDQPLCSTIYLLLHFVNQPRSSHSTCLMKMCVFFAYILYIILFLLLHAFFWIQYKYYMIADIHNIYIYIYVQLYFTISSFCEMIKCNVIHKKNICLLPTYIMN